MEQSKFKILVVEDEPKVASFLERGLTENGFEVTIANDGQEGKRKFEEGTFNAIVLDVNLPFINGLELCNKIRLINQKVPIMMLTALGTTEDKLQGFESGADDYLLKPFEFRELLARLRALLKRVDSTEIDGGILKFQDLEMNLKSYEVIRAGVKIELTQKEFSLLEYLMRSPGHVLSRADIAEKVWDINFDTGTNVIDVYVNFLRKKVDKNFSQKLIHTQTGVGYVLKAGKE